MVRCQLSCLNHFKQRLSKSLRSGFRNLFILYPLRSNALIILILFLQIIWIVEFTRPNFRHTSSFFLPFSFCRITLTFPSTPKGFLLFVTVAMLSLYQSPVNCKSIIVERNFTHKINYRYYFHFQSLEFM